MTETEDGEDDYMSMAIPEPTQPRFETSAQKRARQKREAETRSRPKSKAEKATKEARAREEALSKQIDTSSKGFKLLSKLGYKPGTGLGAQDRVDVRLEPIGIETKDDRGGIGLDSEKKRKFVEEAKSEAKRLKANEDEYRQRIAREREDRRNEGLWKAAMTVLEGLENDPESKPLRGQRTAKTGNGLDGNQTRASHTTAEDGEVLDTLQRPLHSVNLLYRSLARDRLRKERAHRAKYDVAGTMLQGLSDPANSKSFEEPLDKMLMDDIEAEDQELDQLESLAPEVRLANVLEHLRKIYRYCFWCKCSYPDTEMTGCPGPFEDDHD